MSRNINVTITGGVQAKDQHLKQIFDVAEAQTSFTLTYAPRVNSVLATLNGVTLTEGSTQDFFISGSLLVTTFQPEIGDTLGVKYVKN